MPFRAAILNIGKDPVFTVLGWVTLEQLVNFIHVPLLRGVHGEGKGPSLAGLPASSAVANAGNANAAQMAKAKTRAKSFLMFFILSYPFKI